MSSESWTYASWMFSAVCQDGTRGGAQDVAGVGGRFDDGGGDSAASVRSLGLDEAAYGHRSAGAGESLEFHEGGDLPGLAVLAD